MQNFLNNIRGKSESYKQGVALGLALIMTFLIVLGWFGQKGVLGRQGMTAQKTPEKQVAIVQSSITPIESSKRSALSAVEEVKRQYEAFKESISNVLVPFMTGIEVYERK